VTKNGRIYGVLTPATAPRPVAVPDPDAAGARAEAVRTFQEEHPTASLDDIVKFTTNWTGRPGVATSTGIETLQAGPDLAFVRSKLDVTESLARWRKQGSLVEGLVEALLNRIAALIQPGTTRLRAARGPAAVAPAVFGALYDTTGGNATAIVRRGERFEKTGDVVEARTTYVAALFAPSSPSLGAMWRLGDLARRAGNTAEASAWYSLALDWNDIEARGSEEQLEILPPVLIADR
jgi:hypothetical protein